MSLAPPTAPPIAEPAAAPRESLLARPRLRKWRQSGKLAGFLGLAIVVAVGVGLAAASGRTEARPRPDAVQWVAVGKTNLLVTVTEKGDLESARNVDVACEVEGQSTILWIKPEGSKVKKGELVCELDSSTLRDNLTNQTIAARQAEANLAAAGRTREVAEISVREYRDGTFPRERATVQNDFRVAESELARVLDRFEWSNRMLAKGFVTFSQNEADRQAKFNAELTFDRIKTRIHVLENYTKRRTLTELGASVDRARADELAKTTILALEKAKLAKLERQVAKTKLIAPGDGLVVYANGANAGRGNQSIIQEGAVVRERQKIFSLPDIDRMRVIAKIHESVVDRIRPDQPVRVRVDAFPNELVTGVVRKIQNVPESTNGSGSDVKVYPTIIDIDRSFSGLRPGMTAQVEVLVLRHDDVPAVPVGSILEYGGMDHVFVLGPEGPLLREVKLGESNEKLVEVRGGLAQGERVALDPVALMTESEQGEAFAVGAVDGPVDDWTAPRPSDDPTR